MNACPFPPMPRVHRFVGRPHDLFAGQTLVIVGRYFGAAEGEVVLRGKLAGRYWEHRQHVAFPDREPRHEALASVWARSRIAGLLASPAVAWTGLLREWVEAYWTSETGGAWPTPLRHLLRRLFPEARAPEARSPVARLLAAWDRGHLRLAKPRRPAFSGAGPCSHARDGCVVRNADADITAG